MGLRNTVLVLPRSSNTSEAVAVIGRMYMHDIISNAVSERQTEEVEDGNTFVIKKRNGKCLENTLYVQMQVEAGLTAITKSHNTQQISVRKERTHDKRSSHNDGKV